MNTVQTLLSPPSYTALVETRDSVFLPAFRSIKYWKREYDGGAFEEVDGRFQETSMGGGPRLVISLRRPSSIETLGLPSSASALIAPFLSRITIFCRT